MGFCLILILLGVLGAREFVSEKVPAAKDFITTLSNYTAIIGSIALVLGILWFFSWLRIAIYMAHAPFTVLLGLASILLTLALGLMFSLDFIVAKIQQDSASPVVVKLSSLRTQLLPYQKQMSLAAIGLGAFYFLVLLI